MVKIFKYKLVPTEAVKRAKIPDIGPVCVVKTEKTEHGNIYKERSVVGYFVKPSDKNDTLVLSLTECFGSSVICCYEYSFLPSKYYRYCKDYNNDYIVDSIIIARSNEELEGEELFDEGFRMYDRHKKGEPPMCKLKQQRGDDTRNEEY